MKHLAVALLLAAAACDQVATVGSGRGSLSASIQEGDEICEDCRCRQTCDAPSDGANCPGGTCAPSGECSCRPETALSDCPTSGCCAPVLDDEGAALIDGDGDPVYGCVISACSSDDDCPEGLICAAGATCGDDRCVCPEGDENDEDGEPCCVVRNREGACCESGLVEETTGLCVCSGAYRYDRGRACECPEEMELDENGDCVCSDEDMKYSDETGDCECAEGLEPFRDGYTGALTCLEPGEDPPGCEDPYEVRNADTGLCECQPGFLLRELRSSPVLTCAPPVCGNDRCDDAEDCNTCEDDCGPCSCGDGVCGEDESCNDCAIDCPISCDDLDCWICDDSICIQVPLWWSSPSGLSGG